MSSAPDIVRLCQSRMVSNLCQGDWAVVPGSNLTNDETGNEILGGWSATLPLSDYGRVARHSGAIPRRIGSAAVAGHFDDYSAN
jgi:hypothetical protein